MHSPLTRLFHTVLRTVTALTMSAPIWVAGISPAGTPAPNFTFASIDGGSFDTSDWRGKPVLVVNTASMCGFTAQYEDLQKLSDTYAGRAIVLAVPSDDFNQELASDAEVKDFCDVNFGLTLPMTTITHVRNGDLHPFYAWLKEAHQYAPGWNFNKVLIGADGEFLAAWGSGANPMSKPITGAIDAALK